MSTSRDIIPISERFQNITVLTALPAEHLERLAELGRREIFKKGDPLCRRDDPGSSIMVILSGAVKITRETSDGHEVVHDFLRPGEIVGEIAFLDGGSRSATALAMAKTEVLVIERQHLMELLGAEPQLMMEIVKVLCRRLRSANDALAFNHLLQAEKTASGLLRLAYRSNEPEANTVSIGMKISQNDLGAYLGLSRESVNRQLALWRDEGLIALENGVITILDPEAMEAISGEIFD